MRSPAGSLVEICQGGVDRMVAALHRQRAIEAARVLLRYRYLLGTQHEGSSVNEIISVYSDKDISENAHRSDTRERSAIHRSLERA